MPRRPRAVATPAVAIVAVLATVLPWSRVAAEPAAGVATAATAAVPPGRLAGVGNATQVIEVTAAGFTTSYAVMTAWVKQGGTWRRVRGPWPARVGQRGFALRHHKREGDLQTPTGSFTLPSAFGVDADPGTALPWRQVHPYDYWDDDPASARYNLWTDTRHRSAGRDPEPMDDVPVYDDGIVVGYNTARTPGRGSAIFLHVGNGSATVGCVSVSRGRVLQLLRWLRPGDHPRIVMGPASSIRR